MTVVALLPEAADNPMGQKKLPIVSGGRKMLNQEYCVLKAFCTEIACISQFWPA